MTQRQRRHVDKHVAAFIEEAIAKIAESGHRPIYVSPERARRKLFSMKPTQRQLWLLRYIQKRGFVSDQEALGMNWSILGGLRNRHYIEDATWRGQKGIRATTPGYEAQTPSCARL